MRTSVSPARLAQAISRMKPAASISASTCGRSEVGLALLERHGIVAHVRAGAVADFEVMGAESPGAVDFGVRPLPGRDVA